jgi:hypothetical protein
MHGPREHRNPDSLTNRACATTRGNFREPAASSAPARPTPRQQASDHLCRRLAGTQNVHLRANHVLIGIEPMPAPIGGYRVSSLAQYVTKVSAVIPRRIE